jgi:uncharacterized surface protein with fasciclin (FAS1) repeats
MTVKFKPSLTTTAICISGFFLAAGLATLSHAGPSRATAPAAPPMASAPAAALPLDTAQRETRRGASAATAATPPARAGGNILEVATSAGQFSTLVAAIKAAGLSETLNGAGPFTIFAPTDAAFAKLPAGTVESLLMPENKAKLTALLTYHVVPGKIASADLAGVTATPATVQGATLSVDSSSGIKVGGATVTSPDVAASNGTIHVIDTVLIPPPPAP